MWHCKYMTSKNFCCLITFKTWTLTIDTFLLNQSNWKMVVDYQSPNEARTSSMGKLKCFDLCWIQTCNLSVTSQNTLIYPPNYRGSQYKIMSISHGTCDPGFEPESFPGTSVVPNAHQDHLLFNSSKRQGWHTDQKLRKLWFSSESYPPPWILQTRFQPQRGQGLGQF